MPRKRQIDPSFWLDGELSKISDKSKLLYIGLWNFADDNGVLPYNPLEIKAAIFPHNPQLKIEKYLKELFGIKKIVEYDVEEKKYIWIKNFLKHQKMDYPSYRYPLSDSIHRSIAKVQQALATNRIELNRIEKNRIEKKRGFFQNQSIRKDKNGKLWVIPSGGGKWLEFAGDLKEIVWK